MSLFYRACLLQLCFPGNKCHRWFFIGGYWYLLRCAYGIQFWAGKSKNMLPGVALAAVSSIGFLGFLLGPPIIGFISEATNLRFSFALVAILDWEQQSWRARSDNKAHRFTCTTNRQAQTFLHGVKQKQIFNLCYSVSIGLRSSIRFTCILFFILFREIFPGISLLFKCLCTK